MSDALLDIAALSLAFANPGGRAQVLRDVSLTVRPGRIGRAKNRPQVMRIFHTVEHQHQ